MITLSSLITIIISLVLLALVETLRRTTHAPVYITRKLAHFGGAGIAFFSPYFLEKAEIILICFALITCLLITRKTKILSSVQGVDRTTFGELFLPLGVIISTLLFLPENLSAFQFGILVMGISDGLAGIIGEKFAKNYFFVFSHKKSLTGTAVFFITCLLIALFFTPLLPINAFAAAFILTACELTLGYGLDNLLLPVIGGILMLLFT